VAALLTIIGSGTAWKLDTRLDRLLGKAVVEKEHRTRHPCCGRGREDVSERSDQVHVHALQLIGLVAIKHTYEHHPPLYVGGPAGRPVQAEMGNEMASLPLAQCWPAS
jgi:hypothetical protein